MKWRVLRAELRQDGRIDVKFGDLTADSSHYVLMERVEVDNLLIVGGWYSVKFEPADAPPSEPEKETV